MAFDGMERVSQRERFEKLCRVYPQVGKLCDPASLPDVESGQRVFRASSIFGLRLLELVLYLQQDKQRIARCDYCWGWFIPKTKKATRYCDRVTDGFLCKQRGARFKRWWRIGRGAQDLQPAAGQDVCPPSSLAGRRTG